jgi:hypothetical protein
MPVLPFLITVALTSGAAQAAPAASRDLLPKPFQGEWAIDLAQCASKAGDNTEGMTITGKDIGRYEEGITVTRVTILSRNSLRYEGTLSTYDGDEPTSGTLLLSADGKRLLGAGYSEGPDSKGPDLLRCES